MVQTSDALVSDEKAGIDRLREIMRRLRDRDTGCPWDIEQNFASIAPYTIEEAHEVADVIAREAWGELPGELGDLLLQVVYHAQMAEEAGLFGFDAVVQAISDKMIARHPHVFADESREKSAAQQTADWEKIKAAERGPARVGFDWPSTDEVLDKLREEMAELVEARERLTEAEVAEEFGDLLFVMANLARHMNVDPEAALRAANEKFSRRFARIEDFLASDGRAPAQSDLTEMDALWNLAKAEDKARAVARLAKKS